MSDLKPAVAAFAQDIQRHVDGNDRMRHGWQNVTMMRYLLKLKEAADSLQDSLEDRRTGRPKRLIEQAAEVGTWAMMIADRARQEMAS